MADGEQTPAEVLELHRREEIQLVDVRTPEERRVSRIAGDVHIELSDLPTRIGELDAARPIVFYCRSGARSGMATDALRASGLDARNMTGGIVRWHAEALPLEPDGAGVAG